MIFENTADSPDNRLEKNPVEEVLLVVVKLAIVEDVNIGVSVSVYVTSPLVVVAIVRFEFVEEARKLYRDDTEVEAVTPFMIVVTTPLAADIVEELIIEVEEETPLIDEVSVLTAEVRELASTKLAVVVATLPLTVEVSTNELVEVDIVRVFDVEDATRLVRSVEVATPLIVVVSIAPDVDIAFDDMTEDVAVTPLIVVVNVLPVSD